MKGNRSANGEPNSQIIEQNVYVENIRLAYTATPPAAAAIVIATAFFIFLFQPSLPHHLLLGWAGYMLAVVLIRLSIYRIFIKKERHNDPVWGKLLVFKAALTGLGWGACSLLFFEQLPPTERMVLLLVVVSYSSGAMTTTFPVPKAFTAILVPALVPLLCIMIREGGYLAYSISAMLMYYMLFVIFAIQRLRRLLADSLRLRFDNEALVGHLQTEKTRSERLNDSLLEEVEERKKAAEFLTIARLEAEQANMAKTQFLANMSHDIRTPMNGIVGMTRLALETELTAEQKKYLETIKVSSEGLLNLLNDILDFSKIEAGQLLIVHEDFNLHNLIAEVHSVMSYNAQEKGLELIFPKMNRLPAFVKGDELRLRQVLLNLIGNSIKFTNTGEVELYIAEQESGGDNRDENIGLHFQVRDTGIGIASEKQEDIFASFIQADSSMVRRYGGSGLGLAICRQLVKMMGGRIWLESETGKGSTFHFTVVLEPGKIDLFPEDRQLETVVQSLHILVADDNQVNRELASLLLEKDGHSVKTVDDGSHALQAIARESFDLIFMDVQMPVMDGLTASQILRRSERGQDLSSFSLPEGVATRLIERCRDRHIPIIAMTAHAMAGDKDKCLQAGMDGYLTKPIDPSQIKRAIAGFFS